ncbi:hypothetical protein HYPSUDRAFT_302221 [Hypholoma sublateritium FD-334 SS-4]|uniref:Uncharacterized protein n=1 Tax=Hypholoma sublateritium (strain FD-334 SS-4) TaxID=945553 RepID=A0A0D2NHW1_HYPSF|nr:hypothetical protein HYPSUDRAFT_302221 [Hypholoma sublateritium FD-334 SS-4]
MPPSNLPINVQLLSSLLQLCFSFEKLCFPRMVATLEPHKRFGFAFASNRSHVHFLGQAQSPYLADNVCSI